MNNVLAVLERDKDPQVVAAAEAIASMLGVGTRSLRVPDTDGSHRARTVMEALAAEDVVAAALSARGSDPVCWEVMTQVATPLVVLPRGSRRTLRAVNRVLLPLDGSPETATGVAVMAHRALEAGADVVAVHVFDAATVPAFWDQSAHSHTHWTREFLRRNLPEAVELDLRSGRPAEQVLAEADRNRVDLIIIAWGRDLSSGRADTVRHALTHGLAPVLLLDIGRAHDPATAHRDAS